jgi:hypothetical protein
LTAAGRFAVSVVDPASGEFVERINCAGPAKSVQFHAENDRALLVTDARLVGFRMLDAAGR